VRKDNIHNRIARVRFELNINKKQFSELMGVSQPTISRYENGERTPDYYSLEALVNKLSVNPEYIFGNSENIFLS